MVPDSPVYRMSATGGEPTVVSPLITPRARAAISRSFSRTGVTSSISLRNRAACFVGSLDGAERRKLFDADAAAVFAPPREVLFVRGGALYAQGFDPVRLQIEGEPVALASDIAVHPFGGAAVSAAADGSIAYRTGSAAQERQFVWLNRSGTRVGVVGKADLAGPMNLALSPDERHVVFSRTLDGNTDLWTTDVERGIADRFTTGPGPDITPIWLPDGRSILFSTADPTRAGFGLNVKSRVTDAGATPLLTKPLRAIAMDYSRDGRYVLYRSNFPSNQWDIWAVSTAKDATPFPVAQSRFDERTAQFSPDTRWIAYESNESGLFEIYVRPFPGPGTSMRASITGGAQPRWHRKGSELFYIAPDGRLMSVSVQLPAGDQAIRLGSPVPLFAVRVTSTVQGGTAFEYDVTADGQRFLVNAMVEQPTAPISLILNRRPRP